MLPEAPAVDMPLDVPDPVHRLGLRVVVGLLGAEDYVGVVLLAALHLAEDDVPYANLGGLLLERVDSILRCGPHQAGEGRDSAAVRELLQRELLQLAVSTARPTPRCTCCSRPRVAETLSASLRIPD